MQLVPAFFLDMAWKSTAVLAAICLVSLLARRCSAALRHQIWSAAFIALLVLPMFTLVLPAWRVLPLGRSFLENGLVLQARVSENATSQTVPNGAIENSESRAQTSNAASLLYAIWGLGTALSLTQMCLASVALARFRSAARPVDISELPELLGALPLNRTICIRQGPAGSMPLTFGWKRPIIVLPADATSWSPSRRRAVLLHEMAHVQRFDSVFQLLARLTLALFWWQPVAWFAWREFLRERERAADDVVLNCGATPSEYAEHLLEIARSLRTPAAVGSAAIGMARPSQLENRLAAILDARRNRKVAPRSFVFGASLLAFALALPLAALEGQAPITPASAATPLLEQGKAALAAKNYPNATKYFEQAQSADAKTAAEATMWLAVTEQSQDHLDQAADLYANALQRTTPESTEAAVILSLDAALLQRLNRHDEALKMEAMALEIRDKQRRPALAALPMSPDAHKIGGDVKSPILLSKVEPEYSNDARLARLSGSELLYIEIDTDGVPQNIKVIRPLGLGLDAKAIEAVSNWRFKPGTLDGKPVKVWAQVEIAFRLL